MAETTTNEAARAQLATDKAAREKSQQEYEDRMKGKPTPTQEENDLAALGAHVVEKEHDGSVPDPNQPTQHKQSEAHKPGGSDYMTRQTRAGRHQPATE